MLRFARWLAIPVALSLTGCFGGDTHISSGNAVRVPFHQTIGVSSSPSVVVGNVDGSITVRGWNKPSVQINAVIHGDTQAGVNNTHVEVSQSGDTVRIKTSYPSGLSWQGAAVDYTIDVPSRTVLAVTNVSGDITTLGVASDLDASDVSGTIRADGMRRNVKLSDTSGRVEATLAALGGAQTIIVTTVSGDIALRVPRDASAAVTAASVSGGFSSDLGVTAQKQTVGMKATGRIGSGSASVSLNAVSGTISINRT